MYQRCKSCATAVLLWEVFNSNSRAGIKPRRYLEASLDTLGSGSGSIHMVPHRSGRISFSLTPPVPSSPLRAAPNKDYKNPPRGTLALTTWNTKCNLFWSLLEKKWLLLFFCSRDLYSRPVISSSFSLIVTGAKGNWEPNPQTLIKSGSLRLCCWWSTTDQINKQVPHGGDKSEFCGPEYHLTAAKLSLSKYNHLGVTSTYVSW